MKADSAHEPGATGLDAGNGARSARRRCRKPERANASEAGYRRFARVAAEFDRVELMRGYERFVAELSAYLALWDIASDP